MTLTLRITEAHHADNAFWNLGKVESEVPVRDLFDQLPDAHCGNPATHDGQCYIADLLDESGDIVDDCEIPRDVAQALLSEPIPVLRERYKRWLWETYGATG